MTSMNVNLFEQKDCKLEPTLLGGTIRAAANKGFAIAGVPCFADTFVQGASSVLRRKFSAKTPHIANPRTVVCNVTTEHL
jgi:hypothetical protein